MASKFGLAGGIPERRVRPIWDAIDSRQFKNALKLITTLLSKYPNSPYALALKALIFERMGKTDEALSVCLNAKELLYKDDSLLMDDLTLSTLQIVLQRLDHLDLATSCYEHACNKFANNLELMMGLFNCYVREYSFVRQQQTAIKMYKLAGEERFLLWSVCSIQLQVLCDKGGEKLLLLAEGLLKKHIASHSLHEPEALLVYISLLEQQSKYNDALEVLSGNLGSLLMIEVDKLRIQGRLLARAGDYVTAADIYKKILELSPDDWECFLHYLGCLLEDDTMWKNFNSNDQIHPMKFVECKFSHLTDEMFDSQMSSASDLVQKLQRDAQNANLRGLYLVELEIERRKFLYAKKNENKLLESLLQYFLKFGHLACFASDIEGFLQVLSPDRKAEFVEMLTKNADSFSESPTKVLGQLTSIFKVQELTGNIFKLPVGDIEASAVKLAKLYCENLPLSKDLDQQESMYGQDLLSIISNMLVQLFWRTRDFGYLAEAIMVLELGLTIRGYVWQYKILLLHIYSYIGALPLAYERYKALDVKNILTETVSHQILPQMLVSPMWVDSNNLLKDYLKFMDDHLRESADLTSLAYRHRNYTKVIEFVLFKQRLQRSSQYLVARVETAILQLKENANSIEEEERILENLKCGVHFVELSKEIGSKSLTFNEDLQTRPWWTPRPEKNYLLGPFNEISYYPLENVIKEREENVKRSIQRKSLLPRMIYLSVQSASTAFKEGIEPNGSLTDPKTSAELEFLLEQYAKMLGFPLLDAVKLVSEVSTGIKGSETLGPDLVDWLNFAVLWNAWSLNSPEHWLCVNSLLEKLIRDRLRSAAESSAIFGSCQSDLQTLVQIISEPMAWHSLVIQACVRSSLPSGKKKKKTQHSDQSPLTQVVRDSIESICRTVEEVSKWVLDLINKPEEEKLEYFLSSLKRKEHEGSGGAGQVMEVLEGHVKSSGESEVGNWIYEALKRWNTEETARKTVMAQQKVLREFLQICESKIKLLEKLRQQMSHV
ncbi:PREDICTED: phagocyte signaling-impaired protein isoform X2 [Tarenaya hassleriana]|uniref:phagocyte signaling-impaired protein isoform X2 n=1 Tax=Tarenaya hassleriana TaxID=28532 RepID=UPI00053C78C0|nr:PREDICTED: phagocyte signaling-impaired protein isoform X2 [Tarenaya hassleriana]